MKHTTTPIKLSDTVITGLIEKCKKSLHDAEPLLLDCKGKINELEIKNEYGIVYLIVKKEGENDHIHYVGKSKGVYFKSRLRSHFFGIGKGTFSRFSDVKEGKYYLKFIHVNPPSLRNLIEEELFELYKKENQPLWNYKPL